MSTWVVYLVRCKGGTLYTGITTNLQARLAAHNEGTGAKYTRGRGPVALVWSKGRLTHSQALRREAEIKKLSHAKKKALIQFSAAKPRKIL